MVDVQLGRELIGSQPQHVVPQTNNADVGLDNVILPARNTEAYESDLRSDLGFRLPSVLVSQAVADGARNQDTYYRDLAPDYSFNPTENYLPHDQGTTAAPLQQLTVYPWQYPLPPQDSPRHLTPSAHNPGERVIGAAEDHFFAQPQTDFASSAIYLPNRQPQASPLTSFDYYTTPQYNMASETARHTIQIPSKHERKISISSLTDMPTPVSIAAPRSPQITPTAGERHGLITSPHSESHSRRSSVDSSQYGEDERSLQKNHSYKRTEEPPRNLDGKMACKYQECRGLAFDRKCEWSKHMDKHDRPYKCNVPGCEKLQGFTYSGGLLRHEREVHKMHGGTKKSLFCPFNDCKRSSGAGFTRKENLAEHIRRVHRRTSMSADMHGLIIRRDTIMERSPISESRVASASESPYSRAMEFREDDEMSLKRKRDGSDIGSNDEMRAEIKRLRQENEEKDLRLRQLENAVKLLQQNHR